MMEPSSTGGRRGSGSPPDGRKRRGIIGRLCCFSGAVRRRRNNKKEKSNAAANQSNDNNNTNKRPRTRQAQLEELNEALRTLNQTISSSSHDDDDDDDGQHDDDDIPNVVDKGNDDDDNKPRDSLGVFEWIETTSTMDATNSRSPGGPGRLPPGDVTTSAANNNNSASSEPESSTIPENGLPSVLKVDEGGMIERDLMFQNRVIETERVSFRNLSPVNAQQHPAYAPPAELPSGEHTKVSSSGGDPSIAEDARASQEEQFSVRDLSGEHAAWMSIGCGTSGLQDLSSGDDAAAATVNVSSKAALSSSSTKEKPSKKKEGGEKGAAAKQSKTKDNNKKKRDGKETDEKKKLKKQRKREERAAKKKKKEQEMEEARRATTEALQRQRDLFAELGNINRTIAEAQQKDKLLEQKLKAAEDTLNQALEIRPASELVEECVREWKSFMMIPEDDTTSGSFEEQLGLRQYETTRGGSRNSAREKHLQGKVSDPVSQRGRFVEPGPAKDAGTRSLAANAGGIQDPAVRDEASAAAGEAQHHEDKGDEREKHDDDASSAGSSKVSSEFYFSDSNDNNKSSAASRSGDDSLEESLDADIEVHIRRKEENNAREEEDDPCFESESGSSDCSFSLVETQMSSISGLTSAQQDNTSSSLEERAANNRNNEPVEGSTPAQSSGDKAATASSSYSELSLSFLSDSVALDVAERLFEDALRMLKPGGVIYVLDRGGSVVNNVPVMRSMLRATVESLASGFEKKQKQQQQQQASAAATAATPADNSNIQMITRWRGIKP